MRLKDKIAVVTGGTRGIGLATALRFSSEGATVIAADINPPEETASIQFEHTDVTDRRSVEMLFNMIDRAYGRLDILIANAGRPFQQTSLTASQHDWDECLALNLRSVWHCAKYAFPLLERAPSASIVTVASAQGLRGNRRSFPYGAAKGGLLALTRTLAVEYAPRIRVNAIIPGQIESVRTESFFNSYKDPAEAQRRVLSSFPMRRLGQPEDIANAILFLASEESSWITGSYLTVDGGRDAASLDLSDLEKEP